MYCVQMLFYLELKDATDEVALSCEFKDDLETILQRLLSCALFVYFGFCRIFHHWIINFIYKCAEFKNSEWTPKA